MKKESYDSTPNFMVVSIEDLICPPKCSHIVLNCWLNLSIVSIRNVTNFGKGSPVKMCLDTFYPHVFGNIEKRFGC